MTKILKGTKVRVKTTNGGETIGTLGEDYVPSYSVVLDKVFGSYHVYTSVIDALRLKKIEVLHA